MRANKGDYSWHLLFLLLLLMTISKSLGIKECLEDNDCENGPLSRLTFGKKNHQSNLLEDFKVSSIEISVWSSNKENQAIFLPSTTTVRWNQKEMHSENWLIFCSEIIISRFNWLILIIGGVLSVVQTWEFNNNANYISIQLKSNSSTILRKDWSDDFLFRIFFHHVFILHKWVFAIGNCTKILLPQLKQFVIKQD